MPEAEPPLSFEETRTHRVIRQIARGGMGSVHEAIQFGAEGFRKTLAIKTILPRFVSNAEFVRLFIGEAKLVADLVHENIVQVYQLGRLADSFFIAMEYVDGINLEQFAEEHARRAARVPTELAAFIASRVCRGLEYAHRKRDRDDRPLGIVHRDISPRNVLINFEGVVKITDFGIAKARRLMEQDDEVLMGKIEYMSPEQASGSATDARSDLFSLGIVLHELLGGQRLFRGDSPLQVLASVRTAVIPRLRAYRPDVPDALEGIVLKALERDPERRFASAGEMGHALEYFLYRDGYGPTNQTLGRYVKEHFARSRTAVASGFAEETAVETVERPSSPGRDPVEEERP